MFCKKVRNWGAWTLYNFHEGFLIIWGKIVIQTQKYGPQYLIYHSAKLGFLLPTFWCFHAVYSHGACLILLSVLLKHIIYTFSHEFLSYSFIYYNYLWGILSTLYHLVDCEIKAWVFIISLYLYSTLSWHQRNFC